jgi:uncharacterized protein
MSQTLSLLPPAARWTRLAAIAIALAIAPSFAARPVAARPAEPAATAGELKVADENTPVIDRAGVIDAATERQLIGWLLELKQKAHAQVKVLTVPSLQGEDIFAFSQREYDLWKLGEKGKDKGALIVLAPKEHKVRIHVGYGLEGVLPDSWCGTTTRQVARLYFSHGQYSPGLLQLVQAVAQRVAADAGVQLTGAAQPSELGDDSAGQGTMVFVIVFFIMVIAVIVIGQMQRRQQGRWGHTNSGWGLSNFPPPPGGLWGLGGGSGGWSSGGGGGFGGGGFGGGGMSGGGGGGASW